MTSSCTDAGASAVSEVSLPQKRFYRQRAHINPLNDNDYDRPITPDDVKWDEFYPNRKGERVEFADVGCGYGGLLIALAETYPESLSVGMEIRVKVCDFVHDKVHALRAKHRDSSECNYQNCAVIRTNAMKYLPNYFHKAQLKKIFFLFPDPHFKRTKHKWRIISPTLLSEYAYVLAPHARVYTVTDVRELHEWMTGHLDDHPLFRRIPESDLADDLIVPKLFDCSEEGQKVTRNDGEKFMAVFERLPDPE